jgi:hemolysin activation/secretion protein
VPELAEGSAPNFRTLAVQTAIANESQGKNVQIALKEAEEADQIDARIVVTEAKPWNFAVSLANTGSRTTGRDRLTFSGSHANLFNLDHQFTGAYTTSIERPGMCASSAPITACRSTAWVACWGPATPAPRWWGTSARSRAPAPARPWASTTATTWRRRGGYRSYITLGLDDKRFDITEIGGVPIPGQQVRRSRPVMLEYTARVETDTSTWGYSTSWRPTWSPGRQQPERLPQRGPAHQHRGFPGGAGQCQLPGHLGGGWLWSARGQLQYSPDALISGEQFGLGGATSIRGTSERPIAGDKGLMAALEVTTPALAPGLRMVGFLEMGWLRNNNPNGINKPASDQLAGAGFGLRYSLGVVEVSADWGRIINGSVLSGAANPTMPKTGDNKFHVNLSARF